MANHRSYKMKSDLWDVNTFILHFSPKDIKGLDNGRWQEALLPLFLNQMAKLKHREVEANILKSSTEIRCFKFWVPNLEHRGSCFQIYLPLPLTWSAAHEKIHP